MRGKNLIITNDINSIHCRKCPLFGTDIFHYNVHWRITRSRRFLTEGKIKQHAIVDLKYTIVFAAKWDLFLSQPLPVYVRKLLNEFVHYRGSVLAHAFDVLLFFTTFQLVSDLRENFKLARLYQYLQRHSNSQRSQFVVYSECCHSLKIRIQPAVSEWRI